MTGMVVAVALTLVISRTAPGPSDEVVNRYTLLGTGMLEDEKTWLPIYGVLAAYFVVILCTCVFADDLLLLFAG